MLLNKQILNALDFEPKRLVFPDSWIRHIPFAYFMVTVLRPNLIVELGVHSGNSFCAFCQGVEENNLQTKCYGIDTFAGETHSGFYDESIFIDISSFVKEYFGGFAYLIRGAFDENVDQFKDKSIDLLHIDGLHTYEAVRHDFETWLPKVSEDGVILFHDIQVKCEDFGVWRLWGEIKEKYSLTYEFCYGYGLGVLCLRENGLSNSLLDISSNEELEKCFRSASLKIQYKFEKKQLTVQNQNIQNQLNQVNVELDQIRTLLDHSRDEVLQARILRDSCLQKEEESNAKNEREKQELWEGRLWFEQQYENLLQSKSYLLGYHLMQLFKLQKPWHHLYRLALLPISSRFKKRFKDSNFYTDKLRRGFIRISALSAVGLAKVRNRSIKPVEINQQPWSGPLVSVIVTCYNYGVYLKPVLACLEAQSWRNFEIILIDDGSTDPETIVQIDELKKLRQPNLKVMQQFNQGVIAARNNAIVEARGKYIFPLDADDTIDKLFLEKCLLFLENSPEHFFVYTWTYSTGSDEFIWETRDSSPVYALEENRMGFAVFRKTAFDQVGGYNPVMAGGYEDWELCVNLVAHGYVGRVIREPLYNYYVKPGARNYHAIKKHESLKGKIGNLHRATIKAQKKRLEKLAQELYRVNYYLVNLAAGDGVGEKSFLLDLYKDEMVSPAVLKDILLWAGNSSATVLLTLDIRWRDFILHYPDNLFVYYPEEYHPEHDVEPFYNYLQQRYQPQRVALCDL